MKKMEDKRGQIWIETAIYTLIGLALIGMVLGFAMPKIKQSQEKIIIEQSINSMKRFDSLVREVADQGAGNRRQYELIFKKGKFSIDEISEGIYFTIPDLSKAYTQAGANISLGNINMITLEGKKSYSTKLSINYSNYANIITKNNGNIKEFAPAPVPYKIFIFNNGTSGNVPGILIEE